MRRGLAVRADGGCVLGRRGRQLEHRRDVSRSLGVVREPREVRRPVRRRAQQGESPRVELDPPARSERVLDREPGQLVAERRGSVRHRDHSRGRAVVEAFEGVAGERFEQPQLGVGRHDREGLEQLPRTRVEHGSAREHGVADGGRDASGACGEHLDDEERIAAGRAIQRLRVDAVRLRQGGYRVLRKRSDREAAREPAGRQLAQDDPERMLRVDLAVAVADDHERGNRLDTASEQPEDVERRLVRPVRVLEDEDGARLRRELVRQRRRQLVRHRARLDGRPKLAADVVGDRQHRTERARREQRVAASPEHAHLGFVALPEPPHDRRLPDARLAAEQDEMTARGPADVVQVACERPERLLALEDGRGARCEGAGHRADAPPAGPAAQGPGSTLARR